MANERPKFRIQTWPVGVMSEAASRTSISHLLECRKDRVDMFDPIESIEDPAERHSAWRVQKMINTIKSLKRCVLRIDEPGPSRKQRKLKHPRNR